MGRKRVHKPELKLQVLQAIKESGGQAAEIARKFDLPIATVQGWWWKYRKEGERALPMLQPLRDWEPPDWYETNARLAMGTQTAATKALTLLHQALEHLEPQSMKAGDVLALAKVIDLTIAKYLALSGQQRETAADHRTQNLNLYTPFSLDDLKALRDTLKGPSSAPAKPVEPDRD